MTAHLKRGFGAAIILVSTSQFAWAEVTAQDVWSDWKTYMTSVGYEVTGTESTSGDTLTISGLSMSIDAPNGEGTISLNMSSLVFSGNGDGTVAVTMPSSMPLQITGQDGSEELEVGFDITQNGHSMTVSGDPNNLTYQYGASQVGVTLVSLMVEGQSKFPELASATVTMTNVASTSQVKTGDVRSYVQSMSMGSLSYDAKFKNPEVDGNGAFQGSIVGLSFQGDSAIPPNMDSGDFRAMLDAGFAINGSFEYESGNSNFQVVGNGEDFSMKSSSQGGKLGVSVDAAHIAYDLQQKGQTIDVTTNQLPFPVALEMSELGIGIDVPVAQTTEEQDFSFLVRLVDFTTTDMIWGLLDPGAVLPRDPVTVILDLSGKAKIFGDIVNPEFTANLNGPPGEVNALTIKQLLVSAVGSKLSGTGDFTFDNSDLASFNGIPAPTGEANLELVGANGLMGNLIKMGLLAESDAAIPRMMMGMLTIPGDGDDTLISKIEFGEGGSISANGQRIK